MSRIVIIEERCKGCLLCAQACPKEIISASGRRNRQGYAVAGVKPEDMEKCIGCASCALLCPDVAIRVFKTPAKKAKKAAAEAVHG